MTQQVVGTVGNPQVSGVVGKKISDWEYRILWVGVGVGFFLLIRIILATYEGFRNVPPSNYSGGLSLISALVTLFMLIVSIIDRNFMKAKTGLGWSPQQVIFAAWTLVVILINFWISWMIHEGNPWPIFGWEPAAEYVIWMILLIGLALSRAK